jgi:hypothetical protein
MNVDDGFDMPPMRDVPPAVAHRVENRVFEDLPGGTRRTTTRWIGAAAAAAAIVVASISAVHLAGGSSTANTNAAGQSEQAGSGPQTLTLDTAKAASSLDRCQQAVRGDDRFPARSLWQPVFQVNGSGTTVTAARVSGKPVFCEVTPATVTISVPGAVPSYAAGSRTGALLVTSAGTVAGVLDPSWQSARISITSPDKDSYGGPVLNRDGLFVFISPLHAAGAGITVVNAGSSGAVPQPLPTPSSSAITVNDSGMPAGDRSSPQGKTLGYCLDHAESSVVDGDTWNAGAVVQTGGERLIMAVNPSGVAACLQEEGRTQFMAHVAGLPSATSRPTLADVAPALADQPLLAGTLPDTANRMDLVLADGTTVEADVAKGTFAVLLPHSAESQPTMGGAVVKNLAAITCHIFDASGRTLYAGALVG